MKVTRNTPEQLIVENNPVLVALFVSSFALIFIGVGLFLMDTDFWLGVIFATVGAVIGVVFNLAFSRRTQVIFDRAAGTVTMQRKSLLGYSRRSWELKDLSEADVQSSHGNKSTTYRPVLIFSGGMDQGVHPLTLAYYSGSGARNAALAINDWLRSPS